MLCIVCFGFFINLFFRYFGPFLVYAYIHTLSVGGPVTHLYENLTGNDWSVHGESKYCCYSIYRRWIDDNNDEAGGDGNDNDDKVATETSRRPRWEPLVVNKTVHVENDKDSDDDDDNEQVTQNGNKGKKFAWD